MTDPAPSEESTRTISSTALLGTAREVLILHHGETYRLRRTGNDKLILTK